MAIDLVSRADWEARAPRGDYTRLSSTRGVKIHYTGGRVDPRIVDDHRRCAVAVRGIQAGHMDGNGWMDIGYTACVCPHRQVFVGRGPGRLPAANGSGLNSGHYAVLGLVGNAGLIVPPDDMLLGILDAIAWLREKGGAGSEIKGHRDGYATSCLPLDSTEVLTRRGWVPLGAVCPDDEVASWAMDSGTLAFDRPAGFIEPYEAPTMVIDGFETTADHNWITYGQKAWAVGCSCGFTAPPASIRAHVREGRRRGEQHETLREERWKLVRADQMGQDFVYPRAVPGSGPGLDLSDDQIRLMVWLQGDGHIMRERRGRSPDSYGVEWHLRKPRKVERLAGLLRSLDIEHRQRQKTDGTVSIRVYGQIARERIIALLPDKQFHWGLLAMSPAQAEVFLEELMHVDGCAAGNYYSSAVAINLDVVQAVASINGRAAVLDGDVVRLRAGRQRSQHHGRASVFTQGRTTQVGCLTTVNGTLVIRQGGRVVVIGNCPGEALYAWIKRGCPRPGATPTPTSWTEDLVNDLPLLEPGATGRHAKTAFYLLKARGYGKTLDPKVVDPTVYSPPVVAEVRQLQADKGLDDDGRIGRRTWPKLLGL
ncbi:hypothetical protein [Planobispora rosea]|uniref:hypothetical protein n=1 Tax=Planobispora rosea TaxID=35762 RepID=UPI000A7BB7BF|nr:hypothetical protein [Planobispora rosea]